MSCIHAMVPAACGMARRGRVLLSSLMLLASPGLLLLSGCGLGGPPSAVEIPGTAIQGRAIGGQQPVSGAKIYLYAAGTTGYGSAPTSLLSAPGYVTTDTGGNFSISGDYTCPAVAGGSQVYLVAVGGDPGVGVVNPNLVLMSALGTCPSSGTLSSSLFLIVNEISTVASAYSLAQFMNYPGSDSSSPAPGAVPDIGTTGTNLTGLANAFATVNNLMNISTGQSFTVTPAYTGSITAGHVSTVPQRRINTLANILAACVNSSGGGSAGDGSPCGNLFEATTPTATGIPPTDTLQAILNLALNPGPKTAPSTELYNLNLPTAPFQPSLTGLPNDWTIALSFTGGGFLNGNLGTAPAPIKHSTKAFGIAIDAAGNIWATSEGDTSSGSGSVVEFNNQGVPLSSNTTVAAWGGYPAGGFIAPLVPAIDLNGNVWIARTDNNTFVSSMNVLNQSGAQVLAPFSLGSIYPQAMAIDPANGNVWAGGIDNNTGLGVLSEYSSSGTPLPFTSPAGIDAVFGVALDNAGNVWAGENQYNKSTGAVVHTRNTFGQDFGPISVDSSGNIFTCGAGSVHKTTGTSTSVVTYSGGCSSGDVIAGPYMALDGAGNLWSVNTTNAGHGFLSEVNSSNGKLLSPATFGYQGIHGPGTTSDGETAVTLIQGTSSGDAGVGVDGSGNIWVLNYDNGSNAAQGALVEFVGLGAPTATPTALALKNNTLTVKP